MVKYALALVLAWCAVMLHRGEPLSWDELEFFRATRWIAEGKLPFRDFWEHHMPLQWLLFAPVAGLFGGGPGVDSVVALRWAQVPLWIGIFVVIARVAGPCRWLAVTMLLAAPWFVQSAVQYRVDVLGNLAFVVAFALLWGQPERLSYVGQPLRLSIFGALMSLAVLANMRLAPVVIFAGVLALIHDDGRWRFNPRALWMFIGIAAVAAAFLAYLFATGSWPGFKEGVIDYNIVSDSLFPDAANTFWQRLAAPFMALDLAAIVFWLAAVAGGVLAIRDIKRPGAPQLALLLALASLAAIASTGVQYPYHFQLTYILLIPLAAIAFSRVQPRYVLPAVAAAALLINVTRISFEPMRYQDAVMRAADARTAPHERVWDGVGYALRRPPAYRYWFLPAGVRLMEAAKNIEPYDLPQLLANPPAAIVYTERIHYWFLEHPRLAMYVLRHYVPLYRNLWVPGMTAAVGPQDQQASWIVPRSGRYEIRASELLARHPWIVSPLQYGLLHGSQFRIPLNELPPLRPDTMRWTVDGVLVTQRVLDLRRGARLRLDYRGPAPAGVVVVPEGTATLCVAPDAPFVF